MPNEAQIDRVEQFFEDIRRLGGQAEQTAILTNLTVIDAAPVGLTGRIIIQDPRDGDFIPALTVPGINYNTGDLVNVLFVAGTEPVAYQQGSGSGTANVQVDRLWESDFGAVAWSTNATGDLSAAGAYDITTTGDLFVGNITATGNITLPNSTAIIGSGSSNPELGASASANRWGNIYLASSTFINALNSWEMSVGPIGSETVMLTLIDSAQDVLRLGIQPTSGADVDINFNDGQIFLEGSSGNLNIGRSTAFNYRLTLHEASSGAIYISFQNTTTGTGATNGFRVGLTAAESAQVWLFENTFMAFATNNTERVRISSNGSVGFNGTSFGGGAGVLFVADAGTNPSSDPSGGGILYSTGGAGTWRGSGGTITTFGPSDPHCPVCGRDAIFEWENETQGWHLIICANCLARELGDKPWIIREELYA